MGAAIDEMGRMGAIIVPISLPYTKYALATYYIIAPVECSANLSRFDGVKYGYSHQAGTLRDSYELTRGEGFGPEVKRRIMLGTYALPSGHYDAAYIQAQKTRTLSQRDLDQALTAFEARDRATSPTAPRKRGEQRTGAAGERCAGVASGLVDAVGPWDGKFCRGDVTSDEYQAWVVGSDLPAVIGVLRDPGK